MRSSTAGSSGCRKQNYFCYAKYMKIYTCSIWCSAVAASWPVWAWLVTSVVSDLCGNLDYLHCTNYKIYAYMDVTQLSLDLCGSGWLLRAYVIVCNKCCICWLLYPCLIRKFVMFAFVHTPLAGLLLLCCCVLQCRDMYMCIMIHVDFLFMNSQCSCRL